MSGKRLLLAMLLLASCAMAQTQIGNPYDHGPTLPASCAPTNSSGAVFFKTAATIGLYQCLTPNTWTTVGGAVFASGGTLHQVPVANGAGQLVDSVGLSEAYPNFTVNEQLIFNGSVTGLGGMTWGQLAAPTGAAAVQLAATGGFLLHNQAYFYKITATSLVGESTVSNEATFTTGALPAPDTYSATVTWNAVTGATGYNVYRSTVSGSELLLATVTPGNTNSYTDNTNTVPAGAMPTTNTSAGITVNGPITATAFNASNSNGGFSAVEGTGAALTAGAGTDLLWADSTAHALKANYNNAAVGIVATEGRTNTFSVAQIFPAGAANSISLKFGATATEGLSAASTSYLATTNGTNFTTIFGSGASGFGVRSVDLFSWSNSTTTANAATDTAISRGTAGVVDIGTGAAASTAGTANLATVQYRGLAQTYFVTGDFTTSGAGTALEAITGLTWTFPASTAINARVDCYLTYHQNVANVAVAFGFQDASVAPTNLMANALMSTSATAHTEGTLAASATTTATAVVSATPSAITTNWHAQLHFFIEQPSNVGTSVFTIRTSTATQGDTVTVVRGSYCELAQ